MKLLQDKVTVMQASYGTVAVLLAVASAFANPMVFGIAAVAVAILAVLSGEYVHGILATLLATYLGVMGGGMMAMPM